MEDDAPTTIPARQSGATEPATSPVVTAVVVAENPGDWFEEVLTSLVAQDYDRLRVVVIDASATTAPDPTAADLTWRVQTILPQSVVIKAPDAAHFTDAANSALNLPARGQFLLLCQDHIALAPDAVRVMVEEAVRSNAGIVGPKLVEWEDARRIVEVGVTVDKVGAPSLYAERGEFDQEQHDAVREVFAVSSAAMLIRTDLFDALEGYDSGMPRRGFDIDLCWRAHVAGARVMVSPLAVGRCGTGADERVNEGPLERSEMRSSIRSVLSNYSLGHLFRVAPQGVLISMLSMVAALVGGRFSDVRSVLSAWLHTVFDLPGILGRRGRIAKLRGAPDREVRRFQVRGFEAINRRVRERGETAHTEGGRLHQVTNQAKTREIQSQLGVWMLVLATVWFGSRRIFTGQVAVINQFGSFGDGPIALISGWFSSLRPTGLGTEGFAPTVELLIGAMGVVSLGQMGILRTLLTVGMLVVGAGGMYRFMAPFRSLAAQVVAPLIYVAVPLGYNALVHGSWRSLVLLGGLPWILKWLVAASGIAPFAPPADRWVWARQALVAAVWIGVVGAWAPIVAGAVAIVVLGLALGGVFTGRPGPIWRLLVTAVVAVAGAFILHLPWSTELILGGDRWAYFADGRAQRSGDLTLLDLLRFNTGPHGGVPLGWALIVLAGLALFMSRRGRLVWAVRGWMIALLSWAVAWAEQQNKLDFALPEPEVLLTPAALGIALAASMSVLAFERDLKAYRFGWRQAMPAVAVIALLATFLGGIGSTFGGRWDSPRNGFEIATLFLADGEEDSARVLWLGNADVLPVGSTPFVDDLAMAVTAAQAPDVIDLFPADLGAGGELLAEALDIGLGGGTNRLGGLLGPLGIRQVIIVERIAPPYDRGLSPASPRVLDMFAEQLDLEETDVRVGMRVFRNTAWVPVVATFPDAALIGPAAPASVFDPAWMAADASRALTSGGEERFTGQLQSGTELYLASNASENWSLTVDDAPLVRSRAFGWANGWVVPDGGAATLSHTTPFAHRLALVGQLVLWGVVALVILAGRRRT